ncbi:MAG: ATP-binding protein [Coriobacteriia bacterium]
MGIDRVALTVPAKGEYAKTVRMTAASLVSRANMTYDDVEDVKMAAEEAFVYAVSTLDESAAVEFEFGIADDRLSIDVVLGGEAPADEDEDDDDAEPGTAYAIFILEAVCDSYEFISDEAGHRLHIVKQAGTSDGE